MASIITHLVFSELLYSDLFSGFKKPEFLVGTSFPDIRYLGVIEREKTHYVEINLKGILEEKIDFIAGMKFHSLLDRLREEYMVKSGVYSTYPKSKQTRWSLKIFEDELYYDRVLDWRSISAYFGNILDEEKKFGIAETQLHTWHKLIREYIASRPADKTRRKVLADVGFDESTSESLVSTIVLMNADRDLSETINNFYSEFPKIIRE